MPRARRHAPPSAPKAVAGPGHDPDRLRALLDRLGRGEVTSEEVLRAIQLRPFVDLGFARLDTHRHLRKGFPEVVLGLGKTRDEIVAIVGELGRDGSPVLVTKTTEDVYRAVRRKFPHARFAPRPGLLQIAGDRPRPTGRGIVLVVSAGTSDGPVAEEAALTAQAMGNRVETLFDVGVAGIHRLLAEGERLVRATVVIVVAGMEGALPSVVAGIVRAPVIAVPTSTGYGASFGGVAALLGMLNSCASGVTVVNIDNGFGAAYAASLINRHGPSEEPPAGRSGPKRA